eukprot:TRINITY_DN8121_c0_g1_i1.p1 TRINITY_DN8121_c0_g1~~TRINITY_DN8121_c0_g1_i1.p1  ORF type:complete len:680 (+),score=172.79 TRINITY_DN8121_c0_g1_i1:45-2084(+)
MSVRISVNITAGIVDFKNTVEKDAQIRDKVPSEENAPSKTLSLLDGPSNRLSDVVKMLERSYTGRKEKDWVCSGYDLEDPFLDDGDESNESCMLSQSITEMYGQYFVYSGKLAADAVQPSQKEPPPKRIYQKRDEQSGSANVTKKFKKSPTIEKSQPLNSSQDDFKDSSKDLSSTPTSSKQNAKHGPTATSSKASKSPITPSPSHPSIHPSQKPEQTVGTPSTSLQTKQSPQSSTKKTISTPLTTDAPSPRIRAKPGPKPKPKSAPLLMGDDRNTIDTNTLAQSSQHIPTESNLNTATEHSPWALSMKPFNMPVLQQGMQVPLTHQDGSPSILSSKKDDGEKTNKQESMPLSQEARMPHDMMLNSEQTTTILSGDAKPPRRTKSFRITPEIEEKFRLLSEEASKHDIKSILPNSVVQLLVDAFSACEKKFSCIPTQVESLLPQNTLKFTTWKRYYNTEKRGVPIEIERAFKVLKEQITSQLSQLATKPATKPDMNSLSLLSSDSASIVTATGTQDEPRNQEKPQGAKSRFKWHGRARQALAAYCKAASEHQLGLRRIQDQVISCFPTSLEDYESLCRSTRRAVRSEIPTQPPQNAPSDPSSHEAGRSKLEPSNTDNTETDASRMNDAGLQMPNSQSRRMESDSNSTNSDSDKDTVTAELSVRIDIDGAEDSSMHEQTDV